MKTLGREDDKKFTRQFRRDIILLLVISAVSAIGIVLTLKYSIENNW